MSTFQDHLQSEFCPPLDPALVAAIVADYVHEDDTRREDLSDIIVQNIRTLLSELAAEAESQISGGDAVLGSPSNLRGSSHSVTDDTYSSSDYFTLEDTNTVATSSTASDTLSQQPFSSPLGFLHAAFPALPKSRLKKALGADGEIGEVDMEAVVERVLSNEYVRELEERGIEALEDAQIDDDSDWRSVPSKKPGGTPRKHAKKANKRSTTITVVDIRQRQHIRAASSTPQITSPDPWTQLSSVASYLATLIPSHPTSFFQSAFHSPHHGSPSQALRSALSTISRSLGSYSTDREPSSDEAPLLFTMLDILSSSPLYLESSSRERDQLIADALLALRATNRQADSALDVVWLLRELDLDGVSGTQEWGIYHLPASPIASPGVGSPSRPSQVTRLPSGPPPILYPPPKGNSRRQVPFDSATNGWKTVPQRNFGSQGPHPLAEFIPAYNPVNGERRARGSGNVFGKASKGDTPGLSGSAASHRIRAQELIQQRDVAFKEAGRMWQSGNTKTRGGEIAFHFAERARELQQQARKEQLNAARAMIYSRRIDSETSTTIDLHGTTVTEAIQIVKELLHEEGASASKPLKIVTGKGIHSANGVGVLGPAIKSALVADGWNVGTWDAGLVVRGMS